MPIMFFLKNPPLSLSTLGDLDEKMIKQLLKSTLMIRTQGPDGLPLLISVQQDVNIAYIKEISSENLEKLREEQKEMQAKAKGSRIQKPGFTFPGKKGGRPS